MESEHPPAPPGSHGSARQRILAAAVAMLDSQGPTHLSVRAIAKEAAVSVGLVHHYFVSKDELFVACLDSLFGDLLELERTYREELTHTDDIEGVIRRAALDGYRAAAGHRSLIRVMKKLVAEKGAQPRSVRVRVLGPFLDRWSEVLSARTGIDPTVARFRIHCAMVAIGRHIIASDQELQLLLATGDSLEGLLEAYVPDMVVSLLLS